MGACTLKTGLITSDGTWHVAATKCFFVVPDGCTTKHCRGYLVAKICTPEALNINEGYLYRAGGVNTMEK